MPRLVTVSLPRERAGSLVEELAGLDGVLTLSRHRDASVMPPGDLVNVEVLDTSVPALFDLLTRHGSGHDKSVSVTTSEPTSVVSASSSGPLSREAATAAFEEVDSILDQEATMRANKLMAMAAAGVIATVGLVSNSVHIVVGAMVIAPGFEPFLKLGLRVTGPTRSFRRGFYDTGAGWAATVAGAVVASVVLRWLGIPLDGSKGGYLPKGSLLAYWRELTAISTVTAVTAGVIGTLLVVSNRSVLTAGVMIVLALVPGAALVGVGLVDGDLGLAVDGAVRWGHDAVIVTAAGATVFGFLRLVRKRRIRDG